MHDLVLRLMLIICSTGAMTIVSHYYLWLIFIFIFFVFVNIGILIAKQIQHTELQFLKHIPSAAACHGCDPSGNVLVVPSNVFIHYAQRCAFKHLSR